MLASFFKSRAPAWARSDTGVGAQPVAVSSAGLGPHVHQQLTLFDPPPRRITACTGTPRDPLLAGWLEEAPARDRGRPTRLDRSPAPAL